MSAVICASLQVTPLAILAPLPLEEVDTATCEDGQKKESTTATASWAVQL